VCFGERLNTEKYECTCDENVTFANFSIALTFLITFLDIKRRFVIALMFRLPAPEMFNELHYFKNQLNGTPGRSEEVSSYSQLANHVFSRFWS
jgi:hypothetical protein